MASCPINKEHETSSRISGFGPDENYQRGCIDCGAKWVETDDGRFIRMIEPVFRKGPTAGRDRFA